MGNLLAKTIEKQNRKSLAWNLSNLRNFIFFVYFFQIKKKPINHQTREDLAMTFINFFFAKSIGFEMLLLRSKYALSSKVGSTLVATRQVELYPPTCFRIVFPFPFSLLCSFVCVRLLPLSFCVLCHFPYFAK